MGMFANLAEKSAFLEGVSAARAKNVVRKRSFFYEQGVQMGANPLYTGRSAAEVWDFAQQAWADDLEQRVRAYEREHDDSEISFPTERGVSDDDLALDVSDIADADEADDDDEANDDPADYDGVAELDEADSDPADRD